MYPAATLFLDVCVQRDVGPDGAWPLLTAIQLANVASLFGFARERSVRQGGVVCVHAEGGGESAAAVPVHCGDLTAGHDRPAGCLPRLPVHVCLGRDEGGESARGGRERAIYLVSGCGEAPDATPRGARAFEHLIAGIRDVVVFGGGIEYGMDRVIDALVRRRVRTHVVLDAAGAVDEVSAQLVVARWKRRAVDAATVDTIDRLLTRAAN